MLIGPMTTHSQLLASKIVEGAAPALYDAARWIGSVQIRNRGTIGGNLCNASPAGDTTGACLVYQAVLQVHGVDGARQELLADFFLGPGKTRLKPGDIVTGIHFPLPPEGCTGIYLKLGRNQLSDLAIVGVTVLGYPDASAPSGYRFRIALASVAPVPLRATQAEDFLAEQPLNSASLQDAALLAMAACSPIDDVRGSARYRKQMAKNLSAKALGIVWEKLKK